MTPEAREQSRREFIADAVEVLNRSLDYEATLAALAWVAVPTIADWCAVDILEDGKLQRLATAHVDPAKVELAADLQRRYPVDLNEPTGVAEILRSGRPQLVSEITDEMMRASPLAEEQRTILQKLGLTSYIGVPLRRGADTIGAITLVMAESGRKYDSGDLAVAVTLADRASTAIQNAQVFREIAAARKAAEEANRVKDEFLAMLGHELRNPLAPILTALELMQLRSPELLQRERTVIMRQVKHVVRLVDDLLDVSRIARGNVELHKDEIDVVDVIGKAIEIASPLLEERKHELVTQLPRGLMINADPVRLAQVVANLLTNAAKYTDRAGTISVGAERVGDEVVIRVRDTGAGIAPEVLPRVFETFFQARQAVDRAEGGLGLGLAIVKSLVELHGGTVEAHSEGRGHGSELVVRLPATPADVTRARLAMGTSIKGTRPLRTEQILVVDDNADALTMLGDALEARGFVVTRAHDAPSALTAAQQSIANGTPPDVALLDIGLPVMDGYELARRLRELPGLADLALVAVTGYGQASDRERSREAGFAAHLVKPISVDQVQTAIEPLLAARRDRVMSNG